jgi:hypothetical protein
LAAIRTRWLELLAAQLRAYTRAYLATRRRAYVMEVDAPYCDVIRTRWEQFTGKKAERRSAN